MSDETFGLGGIPSPADPLDFQLPLDTAAPLPAGWLIGTDTPISMPPHLNQGNTPMCGGYSSGQLKRFQEKVGKHGVLDFDYAWVYRHSRLRAGLGPETEGTTARAVLATLLHEGIPVRGNEATAPEFRIKSYAQIPYRTDDIRRALIQYAGPVLIGMRWPANWYTSAAWHPDGSVAPRPVGTQGGHLTLLIGWRTIGGRVQFLLWNSWGSIWAGRGNLWVWADDLLPLLHDAWKALDA